MWQKIEKAPKDGTVIDLWVKCKDHEFRAPEFRWSRDEMDWVGDSSGWVLSKHFGAVDQVATHWMPLPEPPST